MDGVVYGKFDPSNAASAERALRLIRSPALLRSEGETQTALDTLGVSPGRAIVVRDYSRVPASDARRFLATGMMDSTNVRMFRQPADDKLKDSRYVIDVAASMISPDGYSLTFAPKSKLLHAFFLAIIGSDVAEAALDVTAATAATDERRDDDADGALAHGICLKCRAAPGYCGGCCEKTTPDEVREFMALQVGGRVRVGCVAWRGPDHAPAGDSPFSYDNDFYFIV